MEHDRFLLALAYAGTLPAAAHFEWGFRVWVGAESAADEDGREAFVRDFIARGEEGQTFVIPLSNGSEGLVHAFLQFGKQALQREPQLRLFLLIEDAQDENQQYRLLLVGDPPEDPLPDHEVRVDAAAVPRDVLLWLQARFGVRFYQRGEEYKVVIPATHDTDNPRG